MTKQKMKVKKNEKIPGTTSSSDLKGKEASYSGLDNVSTSSLKSSHLAVSFVQEVQSMMYALGDCREPILESVIVVEQVVRRQMMCLLRKAAEVCVMRRAPVIGIEDFIYLMKGDHKKLHQLFQFLLFKDAKILRLVSDDGDAPLTQGMDQRSNKRRKICQDFLGVIDQTGELTAILENEDVDSYRLERQERQEQLTRNMDLNTYQEYTEARRVHFMKKMDKFKEWVDTHSLDPKPSSFALEILSHLAYEAVAQIVELSLLVRKDMLASPTDPITQTMAPTWLNDLPSVGVHPHYPRLSASPGSTPLQSPKAASPKSPQEKMLSPFLTASSATASSSNTPGNVSDNSNQGDVKPGTSSTSGRSKSKKKKNFSSYKSSSSLHKLIQHRGIQPFHVKEALRRYQERFGPMEAFSKCYGEHQMRYLTS